MNKENLWLIPLDDNGIPTVKDWQNTKYEIESNNVGVVLGPSGLIDIDLDWPEACKLAPEFLPPTLVSGRASNPSSHYWYKNGEKRKAQKFVTATFEHPSGHKKCICEIRSGEQYTIIPPSKRHGEDVRWENSFKPLEIDYASLEQALKLLSVAALLTVHWREGVRNDLCLGFAGLCANEGIDQDLCLRIVNAVVTAADDEENKVRENTIQATYKDKAENKPIAGFNKLKSLLGLKDLKKVMEWMDIKYRPNSKKLPPLTDEGNAIRLLDLHADRMKHVDIKNWGWIVYQNGVWSKGSNGRKKAYRLAIDAINSFSGDAENSEDEKLKEKIKRHKSSSQNVGKVEACLKAASMMTDTTLEDLDTHKYLLNFKNCMIDLRTGKQIDHDSKYLITCQMSVDYDPDAKAPTFEAGMRLMFGNNYRFVLRALGYSLLGGNEAKSLFILYSPPNGGKSKLVSAIKSAIGSDYYITCKKDVINGMVKNRSTGQDLQDLFGKRFIVCHEMNKADMVDQALVKALVGEDDQRADRKFGDAIEASSPW